MDEILKCETGSHQNPQGESGKKTIMILPTATSYSTDLLRQGKQKQKGTNGTSLK